LFYLCLEVYTVFRVVALSFFRWKGISGSQFIFYGLNNYLEVFKDKVFWLSVNYLITFLAISLLTIFPMGFVLAYTLSHNVNCIVISMTM